MFFKILLLVLPVAACAASPMRLAQATAMDAIRPRGGTDFAALASVDGGIEVRLARNEYESVQIVVTPERGHNLANVRVEAGDLYTSRRWLIGPRDCFEAAHVKCALTGFVRTREFTGCVKKAIGDRANPGWWPDPILDFLDHADVADGDLVSFWIRVKCPADQPAGEYAGSLKVTADGVEPRVIPFRIRVYDFALPATPPIPLAITFGPTVAGVMEEWQQKKPRKDFPEYFDLFKDPLAPVNLWKKHEDEWTDFVADYFIMPDSLYISSALPKFRQLQRLKRQGRLGMFNLTYWQHVADGTEKWRADTLARIRRAYDAAKAEGLLDHAYCYGCDEMPTNMFGQIRAATDAIKAEFPDLPVMTTAYDGSYGLSPSGLPTVDIFVPDTPRYDPERADRARAAGKHVWWYIACTPRPPYANIFIECRPIEQRLLMGAMAVRNRPEGFLYYSTARWGSSRPITSGPFTDWNPRSFLTFHGDGSWFCAGPDGTPLATQRVENFRDGLEDLAYAKILRENLERHPLGSWAPRARELLEVPKTVFVSMTNFTQSASAVYAWRDEMARMIESEDLAK